VTEVGRQPWIVYRVLRVDAAVTSVDWIWLSLLAIVAVYTSMTVIGAHIILSMSRRWRDGGADLPTPYGPGPERS
jgi:cytochrome d ubiquinol oxidase subunit I